MNTLLLAFLALPAAPSAAAATLTLLSSRANAHYGAAVRTVDVFEDSGEQCIASGGGDGTLRVWLLDSIDAGVLPIGSAQLSHEIYNLDALASNELPFPIIATGEGGWKGSPDEETVRLFSVETKATTPVIHQLAGDTPGGYNYCVAISPPLTNGNVIVASSGYYGSVKMRELDCSTMPCTFNTKTSIETKDRRVDAIKFFPSPITGRVRLARSLKNKIFIYEEDAGSFVELDNTPLSHPGTWENFIDVSSNGAMLVSGTDGNEGTIKTFDLRTTTFDSLKEISGIGSVFAIAFSKDDQYIAAGGNGWIKIYEALTLDRVAAVNDAHASRVYSVVFGPVDNGSHTLISSGADGAINVWEFDSTGGGPATTPAPPGPANTPSPTVSPTQAPTGSPVSCLNLVDSKGVDFCQRKAETWCPSTTQCDCTCCCKANQGAVGCGQVPPTCA